MTSFAEKYRKKIDTQLPEKTPVATSFGAKYRKSNVPEAPKEIVNDAKTIREHLANEGLRYKYYADKDIAGTLTETDKILEKGGFGVPLPSKWEEEKARTEQIMASQEATISTAKPQTFEKPITLRRSAGDINLYPTPGRALPSLTPPEDFVSKKEPTVEEMIRTAENAKQSYYREQRRGENISEVTAQKESYTAPTTFLGKGKEVLEYGGYASNTLKGWLLPAVGTMAEQFGITANSKAIREWGEKFADKTIYEQSLTKTAQSSQNIPTALKGGLKDPRYYANTISQMVGFMGAIFGTSVLVTAATKNPVAGTASGFAVNAALESANAYQDMLDRGVNPMDANEAARIYGVGSAIIENTAGLKPAQGTKELLKDFSAEVVKESGYKKFIKTWVEEGIIEEGSQQLLQNAITKTINKDQSLTEGVAESMIGGLVGALPLVGGSTLYSGMKGNKGKLPSYQNANMPTAEQVASLNTLEQSLTAFQYNASKQVEMTSSEAANVIRSIDYTKYKSVSDALIATKNALTPEQLINPEIQKAITNWGKQAKVLFDYYTEKAATVTPTVQAQAPAVVPPTTTKFVAPEQPSKPEPIITPSKATDLVQDVATLPTETPGGIPISYRRAEPKKIETAKDAAKDFIGESVKRGDTLKQLMVGQEGAYTDDYHISIGGYVNGKNVGNDKIIVSELNGKEIDPPEVLSLKKLYDEIRGEMPEAKKELDWETATDKEMVEDVFKNREQLPETKPEIDLELESIPQELLDLASKDWEDNYAEKYGELAQKEGILSQKIKELPKSQTEELQVEVKKLADELGVIGQEWIDKWQKYNKEQSETKQKDTFPEFEQLKDEIVNNVALKDEGDFISIRLNKYSGLPVGDELISTDDIVEMTISKEEYDNAKGNAEDLKQLLKEKHEDVIGRGTNAQGLQFDVYPPQVMANNSDQWSAQIREKGFALDEQLFDTKEEALRWARRHVGQMGKNVYGQYFEGKRMVKPPKEPPIRGEVPTLPSEPQKIGTTVSGSIPAILISKTVAWKKIIGKRPVNTKVKAPTGEASVGAYLEGEEVTMGGMENIHPVEFPEMVALATEMMGKVPEVKKMRRALGKFKPIGSGKIRIAPELFEQKNIIQLAKTMAHEIGHLTDYVPDLSMAHGNLKNRILVVRNHLVESFGENIKNSEYREELKEASKMWRPWDREASTESMKQYRDSSKELYADAISMLYNNPGLLERVAPKFYQAYFENLENKPAMNEAYWELQDLLRGAKEELYLARENRVKKGFQRAVDIQKGFEEKKKRGEARLMERLRQQLDDKYYPVLKKVQEAEANGAIIDDSANPKYLLQELNYINNDNYLLVEKLDREVSKPIKEAGMSDEEIGMYLLLDRIQTGRAEIANPFGFLPSNAAEQLEYLKQKVGADNFQLLQDKVKIFHDEVFKSVEKAVEVGSYNKETFETRIKPNQQNYATFGVVDYLQDYVPATIKKQVGTLKEVANPYHLTILKTAALNKLNALQEAKNSMRDLLTANFPKEISRTKEIRSGKLSVFKTERDRGQLTMLENGKLKSYDVDPYIAKSFEIDDPDNLNVAIKLLGKINQVFKSLVTTYNLGFAVTFNPIRDFKRNYKNIPGASVGNLISAYVKSLPSAIRYSKGNLDEITRQMVADKIINAPIYDYNFDPRDDGMGMILEKYGVIKRDISEKELPATMVKARRFLLKPLTKLLEAMRFTANTFEIISKIAGTKVRMRKGEAGKELAYNVRNYTGTPNWKVRGTQTNTTNEVFIFSNIMKEGLKSDFIIATNPKTRSGYWWKTIKMDYLPKILMFAASAGLFGDRLKDLFGKMTEYDKTNYITIPIGIRNGKVVYARIPHDETGRLTSAILWKLLNFAKDRDINGLQDVLSVGAGQMPNVTPLITILTAWGQYATGKNPYDAFRGRTLIDDTTFQAGGTAGLKKMIQWTANTFGLSQFTTYDPNKNDTLETMVQVLPILNRILKISDYGMTEQAKELQGEEKTRRAREIIAEKEVISKYVVRYKNQYQDIDMYEVGSEVVKDILGHDPETEEEIARERSIRGRLKTAMVVGVYDSRFDSLVYAVSNKEKVVILQKYKKDISADKFNELLETSLNEGIISEEVYGAVY